MRRAIVLVLAAAVAVVAGGCGGSGLGGDLTQTVVEEADRDPAPELSVPSLQGLEPVTLEGRDKPVILNFWASWCEPCTREMPALIDLHNLRPGVDVVGVAVNDRVSDSLEFAEDLGIPFELGVDRSGETAARFNVTGLPVTVVIDDEGRVASVFPGEISREQLLAFADQVGA